MAAGRVKFARLGAFEGWLGILEALPQKSSIAPFADQNGVLDYVLQLMTPDSTDEFVQLANQHPDQLSSSQRQLNRSEAEGWTKV